MSTKKHTIYVINTSDNGKTYWNRAGVAFENRDGSFTFVSRQLNSDTKGL